jgi:hypothetical protein
MIRAIFIAHLIMIGDRKNLCIVINWLGILVLKIENIINLIVIVIINQASVKKFKFAF